MTKEKLQEYLSIIELEKAKLEGQRMMVIHIAQEENIIDEEGKFIKSEPENIKMETKNKNKENDFDG